MARLFVLIILLNVLHIIPSIEANDQESRIVSHGVDSSGVRGVEGVVGEEKGRPADVDPVKSLE
jgi:CheY-specific phosphatase CheX